ncbi:MAG: hypothetical protein Q9180_000673 [Flavoplaca navasiana]
MAAITTGVEATVAKVLKAAADFQEIAEKAPNSGSGRAILQMGIDHQLREFIDEWKTVNAKLTEQLRLAESDRANTQAKDRESDQIASGWQERNSALLQQLQDAGDRAERLASREGKVADRERRLARNEQALSDGQRRLQQEQERLREEQEKLKKKQEKLKEQQEKLKEEQGKLKEGQEKLKEGQSSLIEARGHLEAEKKTAEDVLRNLRLSEGEQQQREKELERRETVVRSRESALEGRETQASLMDAEAKLRAEALQQHEESIKSGIEQKATDQMTRLISQFQLDQLPTQFVAAASSKFTRIEDCIAETDEAIVNRLNALEGSLQEALPSKATEREFTTTDRIDALEESLSSAISRNTSTLQDSVTDKAVEAGNAFKSQSTSMQDSLSSKIAQIEEAVFEQSTVTRRVSEDLAKQLTDNLKDIDRKVDAFSKDLESLAPAITAQGEYLDDFETVKTILQDLKKEVSDLRQRIQLSRLEKRPSELSLPETEARRRRVSGRGEDIESPGSQQHGSPSRPESPLTFRSSRREPSGTSQTATTVTVEAAKDRLAPPEGALGPIWQQIQLRGLWTDDQCRQLMAFLQESANKKVSRYQPVASLDQCANQDRPYCFVSYMRREQIRVPDPRYQCPNCNQPQRELCLNVKFVGENLGAYDESSTNLRWSLEIRPRKP